MLALLGATPRGVPGLPPPFLPKRSAESRLVGVGIAEGAETTLETTVLGLPVAPGPAVASEATDDFLVTALDAAVDAAVVLRAVTLLRGACAVCNDKSQVFGFDENF